MGAKNGAPTEPNSTMKTTLAILVAALITATGAFADQPVFNSKGTLLYIKRDTQTSTKAFTHAKGNAVPRNKSANKSCCAR